MKFNIIILLLAIILSFSDTAELKLVVRNIYPLEGKLYIAIYDNKDNFLNLDSVAYWKIASVEKETEIISIPEIKTGNYAVSIFHDLNGNGKLDASTIGIPKEPYGFSNDARGRFGPPKFKDATFRLDGDMEIHIKMANNDK